MKRATFSAQSGLEMVFIAISIATFQHTMWAAGFVFDGLPPAGPFESIAGAHWWFNGALIAVAVDLGMFFTARTLAKQWNWILFAAFVLAAFASYYTQVFYSVHHTTAYAYGSGVSDYWIETLRPLIDARIVIVPLILPGFAVVYTFASLTLEVKHKQAAEIQQAADVKTFVYNGKIYGPYETAEERDRAYNEIKKKAEARQRRKERKAEQRGLVVPGYPKTVAPPALRE